jgi:hypothetical protein
MLEFENLMSETDPFRLDAGKYRLSWRAEKMGIYGAATVVINVIPGVKQLQRCRASRTIKA